MSNDTQKILIIGASLVVLYMVLDKLKFPDIPNPFADEKTDLPKSQVDELKEVISSTGGTMLSNNELSEIADSLYVAFNPFFLGLGTDEQTVYASLNRLKSRNDWYGLLLKYGKRDGLGLVATMYGDLSSGEMKMAKDIILKKTGITI